MNVHADAGALADLHRLGVRSVPVVARGTAFVFGQVLAEIAEFVGIEAPGEALPPAELVERLNGVLAAAGRYLRQIPDDKLDSTLPGRDRSLRRLGHHVFVVADAFLAAVDGAELTYQALAASPPPDMRSGAQIAAWGDDVRRRVAAWWEGHADRACAAQVATYYGAQSVHQVLERTAWHAAQHGRQLMMAIDGLGIAADGPLTDSDLAGLPLPRAVWDD